MRQEPIFPQEDPPYPDIEEGEEKRLFIEYLARSAAAITIQCRARAWLTKRKYIEVLYGDCSVRTFPGDQDLIDNVEVDLDFTVQVSLDSDDIEV